MEHVRASLAMALTLAGAQDEAIALTDGLVATAESTQNPYSLSQALLAVGLTFRDTDPPSGTRGPQASVGDRPSQRQPVQRIAHRGCAVSA